MPIDNKWGYMYFVLINYVLPLVIIITIYMKIIKYMKKNPFSTARNSNVTSQHRQQSEFRLIRRILMIITALCVLAFPKIFSFIAIEIHLMPPWPYMTRVDRMFVTLGQCATMFINLITTDAVRKALISIIKKYIVRKNQVQCITAINIPN